MTFNPSDYNIKELLENADSITTQDYSNQDYLNAIIKIQSLESTLPQHVWGRKWKQELAKLLPFILKLLHKSYNNFKLYPISTRNFKWIDYSEEEFTRYCKSFNISATSLYFGGLSYKSMPNNKGTSFHWSNVKLFDYSAYDLHHVINRKLALLEKVGAVYKVVNARVNYENHYLYSSKYIVSKDKLRELVSLIINSYYTSIHTNITSTIPLLSLSSSTLSNLYSLPLLGDTFNAPVSKRHTLIEYNNAILPEEEQLSWEDGKRRLYSNVCGYTNLEKQMNKNSDYQRKAGDNYKEDYLDLVFGKDNWFEFDRKGSIYNLTYSLNKKDYLDNDIDIYEKMNAISFSDAKERQLYKATQMSVYFSTVRRQIAYMLRYLDQIASGIKIKDSAKELIGAWWCLYGNDEGDWNKFIAAFTEGFAKRKKAMKKFIGDNTAFIDKGSKYSLRYQKNTSDHIFIKESEVYLDFVTKLRKMGLRVVQIYDGFYLRKDSISKNDLNNILKDTVLEYCGD